MVYKIFLVARAASCYTRENALPLAACHLTFRKIEFRTRTRMMRWDLLIHANTKFRGQVYPTIPLALSMACYKFVKIR
jgi:hypothetical protein